MLWNSSAHVHDILVFCIDACLRYAAIAVGCVLLTVVIWSAFGSYVLILVAFALVVDFLRWCIGPRGNRLVMLNVESNEVSRGMAITYYMVMVALFCYPDRTRSGNWSCVGIMSDEWWICINMWDMYTRSVSVLSSLSLPRHVMGKHPPKRNGSGNWNSVSCTCLFAAFASMDGSGKSQDMLRE